MQRDDQCWEKAIRAYIQACKKTLEWAIWKLKTCMREPEIIY